MVDITREIDKLFAKVGSSSRSPCRPLPGDKPNFAALPKQVFLLFSLFFMAD